MPKVRHVIRMGFVANFISNFVLQQCKNFENRLRFDKVTESLKVGTFFETQCISIINRKTRQQCMCRSFVASVVEVVKVTANTPLQRIKTHLHCSCETSNVTDRHRSPKRKLWAGYRALSLKCTSCCNYFSSPSAVSCAFSTLCVYSMFRHHPHPVSYVCAKCCFFCSLHC